jgi:putative transposase
MPRRARQAIAGYVYHVLNRAVGRMDLFRRDADYQAFERVLTEAIEREPVALLTYCLMPNHWHMVVSPTRDGQLSRFMFWLTMTHVQRWRHARGLVGLGPLYQGRFRAYPVQEDGHFLTVCRYVERNPLRARLVGRAQDWPWSGLHVKTSGNPERRQMLREWPVDCPANWVEFVNEPQTDAEVEQLRQHVRSGRPLGTPVWVRAASAAMGLSAIPRPRGRPRRDRK